MEGSRESWTEGPLATQGFTPGSNGFTGFGPLTAGNWTRTNFAAYGQVDFKEVDNKWLVDVAGRVENFSDFGLTINGKVAARVSLSDAVALRGAASTGFRAPTPGQQNAFNISTIYDPDIMDLTNNGTIPSTSVWQICTAVRPCSRRSPSTSRSVGCSSRTTSTSRRTTS